MEGSLPQPLCDVRIPSMQRTMAKAKTREESPAWAAPMVTDRINQLQVAVSNHKGREKPLMGGAPLVLPDSATNRPLGRRSRTRSKSYDPYLKRRHIQAWTYETDDSSASRASSTSSLHDENKLFDPFKLGTTAKSPEAIDEKIDAYLQKAALYEHQRNEREDEKEALRKLQTDKATWFSGYGGPETERTRSVSFDLTESSFDITKLRKERKGQRTKLLREKARLNKRGEADTSPTQTTSTQGSGTSGNGEEDFFDVLVAKSSSSSHGATNWFEGLLPKSVSTEPEDSIKASTKREHKDPESTPNKEQEISFTHSEKSQKLTRKEAQVQSRAKGTPPNLVANPAKSFKVETVLSADSDEWGKPSFLKSSQRKAAGEHQSPNWKSQGKSRTDHLLKSIDFESSRNQRGVYDAFGMRRDPEAQQHSSDQKEPEGILGNQLSESSSQESGMSAKKSFFPSKTENDAGSPGLVKTHSKLKSYYDRRQSLIDVDLTMSSSDSVKSPEDVFDDKLPLKKSKTSLTAKNVSEKRRKNIPDDESSIFSNLPAGSITPSLQAGHTSTFDYTLPQRNSKEVGRYSRGQDNQSDFDQFCETQSDAALFEGHRPVQPTVSRPTIVQTPNISNKRPEREVNKKKAEVANKSSNEILSYENGSAPSIGHCITSDSDSSGKTRAFWNSLANFKTLGSFDSDSIVNESSGRRTLQRQQPFIDRNPDATHARNMASVKTKSAYIETVPSQLSTQSLSSKKKTIDSFPHLSDARFLSGAPLAEKRTTREEQQRIHQSAVWMAPIPEQKSLEDTEVIVPRKLEKSRKDEESALFSLMGPLMSADTDDEEDVTTLLTDDFTATVTIDDNTRQDENGSVVVQQSCYSCDGFNLSSLFGWFYSS